MPEKPSYKDLEKKIFELEQALSEKKTVEKMLKRTESIAHVGSWEWLIATDSVIWSEELFKIFKLDPNEGAPSWAEHSKLYHPEDFQALNKAVKFAIANKTSYELKLRALRTDGEIRLCKATGFVEMDFNKKPVRLVGSLHDITKQERLESTLQFEQKRFQMLLENIPGYIYLQAPDYTVRYANKYFKKHFGDPKDRLCYEVLWNRNEPCEKCPTFEVFDTQKPISWEWKIDNTSYIVNDFPFIDADGSELVLEIGIDITERKKIEESMTKSESLFRGLYDNMTSGSAIYKVINDGSKGSDFIIKSFNQKSLEIEGKTLDQVVGKSLFELRPNIDDYGLISVMRKVWETGEPAYFPVKIYQDEMFSNYYENYIFKIPTGEVVTIYNDVTAQKNAEKALRKSEERFALAMEFANDGLFDWNLESNEIYYSPVWKRILGYENDELPNDFSVWETLTNPEDAKRSWKMQNELINKQRDRFEIEFRMKHKDGHWVDILSRANATFDENNNAVRVVGTHVDISERKKLENQLLQSQKLESIGTLAGGIAHEFNNILSIIVGNNELLMDELPEWSLARDNSEEIRIAGLRARDVVKQLLTFTRQDNANLKPLDIGLTVKEAMKLIRSSIPANIDIHQTIADKVSPVFGNPTQINQILINLCSNAADAMIDTGGGIQINLSNDTLDQTCKTIHSALNPGQHVKLVVGDTGSGMDKKTLDRIFEPYFTTKDFGKGSGIGLAIVHGIVEKHSGVIFVESALGQGTTFTILLPAYQGEVAAESDGHTELPTGNERVLFVEDEPILFKLGKQRLERLGYTVQGSTDPREALKIFKENLNTFDLVITDMAMPHMTGDQLVSEILKLRPEIPTMLCTGYSEKISEEKSYEIGFKAFIMKPVDRTEFAVNVRNILDEAKN